tara:strand:+ start:306 stop:608 length:303 start_codon:yes stop_codon:yes gene_type:complete
MYIAMNRFKIVLGKEKEFENIWLNRESRLDKVPGFVKFNLVRGESNDDHTLYASHSTWASEKDFVQWTKSESFRNAHKDAGKHKNIYIGHPEFEGFKVVV